MVAGIVAEVEGNEKGGDGVTNAPVTTSEVVFRRKPGDLCATHLPDGTFRLVERIGDDVGGYGDVTFELPDKWWFVAVEARQTDIDTFIGKPFDSVDGLRSAMLQVNPAIATRVGACSVARGLKRESSAGGGK